MYAKGSITKCIMLRLCYISHSSSTTSTTTTKLSLTLGDIQNLCSPFLVVEGNIRNFDATTRWEYAYDAPKSIKSWYEMLIPCWVGIL
jgi:hypothetical protein